jgi:F-type H+-transporting ATPase subunit b
VAQAINFIIVFSVLYIFALKPLGKLMAERSEKIAKGVSDAKKNAEILSSTQKEYDEALSKAKAEANAILQEGKKIAETKKNEMMEEAKAEVAKIVSNGKKTMEAEKVKMVEEAKKEIVTLAIEATKKIMEGQTK